MIPSSIVYDERISFSKEELDSPRSYQTKSFICTAMCYSQGEWWQRVQKPAQGSLSDIRPISFKLNFKIKH